MPTIELTDFDLDKCTTETRLSVYNAADCCVTHELATTLQQHMSEAQLATYRFTRAMAAVALDMQLVGIRIDRDALQAATLHYADRIMRYGSLLGSMAEAVWGKGLNENSPLQLKDFFYKTMQIPPIEVLVKGVRTVSTNREALEKIEQYLLARPIAKLVLALRDSKKKLSVLRAGIDPDGRMRCAFSAVGTDTGRWSSRQNPFGGGMNFQNPTEVLRRIFVADPGYKLAYIDLEQAESRTTAALVALTTGDFSYWDACESGDLHTEVCKMVWTNRDWPADAGEAKRMAEMPFYRHFSYRDMAKRGGHGTNYYGQPPAIARNLHIDRKMVEMFQQAYFSAFPGIPQWHHWVIRQIETKGSLTTPTGRFRTFLSRRTDPATHRSAIAHGPQSMVGDILNTALWNVWHLSRCLIRACPHRPPIRVLGQVHDAIVLQYLASDEAALLAQVVARMSVPLTIRGRVLSIPCDVAVGWNWAKADPKRKNFPDGNPHGLAKYKGVPDARRAPTQACLVDSRL